jgi:ABC-type nitrate/sulfonate/bicarbonate transport system substrate-binding protein
MDHITISGYYQRPAHIVAARKGFFAEIDLDVGYHEVALAPEHNRELAEGRWPLTISSADTMLARATQDGVDYVLVMQAETGLNVQLVVQPGITGFEDLRGKLFAADPVDSNFDAIRNKMMLDEGLTEADYRIEVIGNTPIRLEAFLAGKVAAAMLTPPHTDKAVAAGGRVLAEGADYVADWPLACAWGLRSWIEANRSVVVRFIRGWVRATDWLLDPANRDAAIQVMVGEGYSASRAAEYYRRVVPKCAIDAAAIRKNIGLRIELGYYRPPHRPTEAFYDACYWAEATGLSAPPPVGLAGNAVT